MFSQSPLNVHKAFLHKLFFRDFEKLSRQGRGIPPPSNPIIIHQEKRCSFDRGFWLDDIYIYLLLKRPMIYILFFEKKLFRNPINGTLYPIRDLSIGRKNFLFFLLFFFYSRAMKFVDCEVHRVQLFLERSTGVCYVPRWQRMKAIRRLVIRSYCTNPFKLISFGYC